MKYRGASNVYSQLYKKDSNDLEEIHGIDFFIKQLSEIAKMSPVQIKGLTGELEVADLLATNFPNDTFIAVLPSIWM